MRLLADMIGAFGQLLGKVLRRVSVPALGLAVVGYFAYYAVHGDRGLVAMKRLKVEIAQAEQTLAEVQATRERMDQRARLLRSDHLDPDMLEERARKMLNVARPQDVIIMLPQVPKGEAGP